MVAWHAVCHIRTRDTDRFSNQCALRVLVNLSLASGDEELGITSFQRQLESKKGGAF